jgi:hypothetical protein
MSEGAIVTLALFFGILGFLLGYLYLMTRGDG